MGDDNKMEKVIDLNIVQGINNDRLKIIIRGDADVS